MFKNNLFSVLFVALFSFAGMTAAQAQVFCNGTSSCPTGYAQIEVTNNTPCDYSVTVEYDVGGTVSSVTCTVASGGTLVMCYDYTTTNVKSAEVADPSGQGAWMQNPGYPGSKKAGITNGGCGGNDIFYWYNDNSTGPGHVTNFIIQ